MARPTKRSLDYFPFDVDFFDDEKLVAISGEYGIKGEITTVKLLCAIYRNGYFIQWNELLKYKLVKSLPGVSADLLESVVKRLVQWGFFDKNLFDTSQVLTSRGIQRRYFEASRRRKNDDDYPYLLVSVYNNPVSAYNNSINVCQKPIKERKEEKKIAIKEKTPPPDILEKALKECYAVLAGNSQWLETLVINTRSSGRKDFDMEQLRSLLALFFQKLQNEGVVTKSVSDAMSHFARWLRIELGQRRTLANEQKRRNETCKREEIERLRQVPAQIEARRCKPPEGYTALTWYHELKRRAAAGDKEAAELLKNKQP